MDFMNSQPISINLKRDSYEFIFVIINWLIKMVYYKPIMITIDAWELAEIIINMRI